MFSSIDLDSCPCCAVSLPVLEQSTAWFHASVPICSLGTVASLVTGLWRTLPRFCDSRVCVSAQERRSQRRLTHIPPPITSSTSLGLLLLQNKTHLRFPLIHLKQIIDLYLYPECSLIIHLVFNVKHISSWLV